MFCSHDAREKNDKFWLRWHSLSQWHQRYIIIIIILFQWRHLLHACQQDLTSVLSVRHLALFDVISLSIDWRLYEAIVYIDFDLWQVQIPLRWITMWRDNLQLQRYDLILIIVVIQDEYILLCLVCDFLPKQLPMVLVWSKAKRFKIKEKSVPRVLNKEQHVPPSLCISSVFLCIFCVFHRWRFPFSSPLDLGSNPNHHWLHYYKYN